MSATICGAPWVHAVAPCKFDLHVVGEWSRRQSQHCSNCRRAEEVGHPVCFSVWIRRSRSTACSACDTKRSPTKTHYFLDARSGNIGRLHSAIAMHATSCAGAVRGLDRATPHIVLTSWAAACSICDIACLRDGPTLGNGWWTINSKYDIEMYCQPMT